jgi:hypothetical protein
MYMHWFVEYYCEWITHSRYVESYGNPTMQDTHVWTNE